MLPLIMHDVNDIAETLYTNPPTIPLNVLYNNLKKASNCTERIRHTIDILLNKNTFSDNRDYKKYWDTFTNNGHIERSKFVKSLSDAVERTNHHQTKMKQLKVQEIGISEINQELDKTKKELALFTNKYSVAKTVVDKQNLVISNYEITIRDLKTESKSLANLEDIKYNSSYIMFRERCYYNIIERKGC